MEPETWCNLAMRVVAIMLVCLCAFAQNRATLTPKEISDGWLLIYDGESVFGWSLEGGAQWSSDPDGVLSARSGESGDMVLTSIFGDYQLTCDIRTPDDKGSGLLLSGVQMPPVKPNDKWHSYSVTSSGGRLVATVDGKKVLDQQVKQLGTIVLHYRNGDRISFRQLKLKPLGLSPLFNGKDLNGWREVPARQAKDAGEWAVKDGMIHVEHGPGQLETNGQYKDFVLQLDIRANSKDPRKHPLSGVFLRGDANGVATGYEAKIHNDFKDNDRSQPLDFGTGGIDRIQPTRKVVSNDNEFFTKTILVRGRHFSVWVNGIQLTDWDDPNPEGAVVANNQAKLGPGNISLQAHDAGSNVDFQNVRIAELK